MDTMWFEMQDVRRRKLDAAVWIPLRVSEHILREGRNGYSGYKEEFLA